MTHIVKGFSVVNEAEVDVFLEFSCFFYDLTDVHNLISGTVEMMNRFKRLDLVDRVPEELWTEVHDIVQEAVIKTIPKKKKCKKVKWLSDKA